MSNKDKNTSNTNSEIYNDIINEFQNDIKNIMLSGGPTNIQKQHNKGRLTAP